MITLYSHTHTPNGKKVAVVLEELGIKYEAKYLDFGTGGPNDVKGADHTKLNPNGRIPTIVDHDNGDFTLWESATIIRYLVDRYDTNHKLSYPRGSKEAFQVDQWTTFQASGQGPYFGQLAWFRRLHPEKLPSAIERYEKEVIRVATVLDGVLSKQKYLVGDKLTVADLIFFSWDYMIINTPGILDAEYKDQLDKLTNFKRWHDEVAARAGVKKIY